MRVRQRVVLLIAGVMGVAFLVLTAAASWATFTRLSGAETDYRKRVEPLLEDNARKRHLLDPPARTLFLFGLRAALEDRTLKRCAVEDRLGRRIFAAGTGPEIPPEPPGARAAGDLEIHEDLLVAPLKVAGESLGRVRLEFALPERPPAREIVLQTMLTHGLVVALCALVLIGSLYLGLDRWVLRPLDSLAAGSRRVAHGDYSGTVPELPGRDEIAELLRAFNAMTAEVRDYHANLERRVAEATERVKATERKMVLAQRLAAMGTLAAGIAHEVNNPIGGMINAARRIQPEVADGRPREYLGLILDGLQRIQEIVKKILTFTPRKVTPEPVDLREVARRAVALARHRLDHKGVALVDELPEGLPAIVGEANELQQVFLNLILNAVDATGKGGRIALRGRRAEKAVEVDVADTGCGMDEAQVARAFDLFYTTKEQGEGTGLGLAICHNIVTSHGGTIEIESRKGQGTTMRLRFPLPDERGASGRRVQTPA